MNTFNKKLTTFVIRLSLLALVIKSAPLAMADGEIEPFCLKNQGCAYFDMSGNRVIEPIDVDDAYGFGDSTLEAIENSQR